MWINLRPLAFGTLRRWRSLGLIVPGLALIMSLSSGCAHHPSAIVQIESDMGLVLPQLTGVLTGPAGICLTNSRSYTAEATVAWNATGQATEPWHARLLVREQCLRLEMTLGKSKADSANQFGVIWDAQTCSGWFFCEALQGCAALDGSGRFTNILAKTSGERPGAGLVEVVAANAAGEKQTVQASTSKTPPYLPSQVVSLDGTSGCRLLLAGARAQPLPEEWFQMPAGFTRYASQAALLAELAARESNWSAGGAGHREIRSGDGPPGEPDRHHNGTGFF